MEFAIINELKGELERRASAIHMQTSPHYAFCMQIDMQKSFEYFVLGKAPLQHMGLHKL
jgi:hypothetical protein